MTQLYRFAEFGRISSGLFHDLINPLNAVSLNLGKVNGAEEDGLPVRETKQYVDNAVRAAKKLEDLVVSVRRQLMRQESKTEFLINEEIKQVLNVLSHKAQKANVQLRFEQSSALNKSESNIRMFGDAIKFNQVVLNLVANGIEACLPSSSEASQVASEGWVLISLTEEPETVTMIVQDNGMGIPEGHMDKIFEPFFTTKGDGQGMGIGLSLAKRIVEKDFGGVLTAKSEIGKGSLFKASLPVPKITVYAK